MKTFLTDAVRAAGDHTRIRRWRPVSGGDINEAFFVETSENQYFIKTRKNAPDNFFTLEALGLDTIRKTDTIAVPEVFVVKDARKGGFLVLEWIEGRRTGRTGELLGRQLAEMHRCTGPGFGFERDNFIGLLPQKNGYYDSWIDYYRECRILPQVKMAEQKGLMDIGLLRDTDYVLEHLDKWLPDDYPPSLLHGDLWGGNWMAGKNGQPYLIDPAVLYGHNEFELAFTELFGGFPREFYRAYREIMPVSDTYEERKPLYQLFYLLVHLNLFGRSYYPSVHQIISRYAN